MSPSHFELNHESDQTRKERATSYSGLGISLGASLDFMIGLLLFESNIGLGTGIGAALGLVIGSIVDTQRNSKND